jgi:hypothetical protein
MRTRLIVVAATLLLSTAALAAPKSGQRVSIMSCAYAGATANCLMIKDSDGTIYDITALSPRPRLMDRVMRVRGMISDKASMCNQGIVLERIRWSRTRQKCGN